MNYYNFSRDADDAFKLIKEQYPDYDVVLFNIFHAEFIDLASPDLHQEILTAEKFPNYPKIGLEIDNFRRMIGNGLLFSEGGQWKMKKKVLQ